MVSGEFMIEADSLEEAIERACSGRLPSASDVKQSLVFDADALEEEYSSEFSKVKSSGKFNGIFESEIADIKRRALWLIHHC
jgi:hypothetical protein